MVCGVLPSCGVWRSLVVCGVLPSCVWVLPSCGVGVLPSCGVWVLRSCAVGASHRRASLLAEHGLHGAEASVAVTWGLSSCGHPALEHRLLAMVQGLSCSAVCGILPDQELDPCLRHRQADSSSRSHQVRPDGCAGGGATLQVEQGPLDLTSVCTIHLFSSWRDMWVPMGPPSP